MCGIAGVVGPGAAGAGAVDRMVAAMRHRGPDDHGTYQGAGAALGATRLAIFDLSAAGHQPMSTPDGRYTVAFNGEIYNWRELRAQLEAAGRRFVSQSDTEVLLHAFAEHGDACLAHLRGMFAFAAWDAVAGRLLLARDPAGIKPLVYAQVDGDLVFASELKALLASGRVARAVEPAALVDCLTLGYVVPPRTAVAGVRALEPGRCLVWERGQLVARTWWRLPDEPAAEVDDYPGAVARVRERVRAAVTEQMRADVPVGLFLSGGLDSSIVLATMAEHAGGPVECFTLGYEASAGVADERAAAATTARRHGARHHAVTVTGAQVAERFSAYVAALDQPSIDGLNSWWVSALAREHVTVALSGLGGDELFGGYGWAADLAVPDGATARLRAPLAEVMDRFARQLPAGRPRTWARRWAQTGDLVGRYALRQEVTGPETAAELLEPGLADAAGPRARLADPLERLDDPTLRDPLRRVMRLDLATFMAARLLRDLDAVGMACSLEVRFPLLDHRLIEDAFALPARFKVGPRRRGGLRYGAGTLKRVLFDAFARDLPPDLGGRTRRGFEMPFARWLRDDLTRYVEPVLRGGASPWFARDARARLWTDWQAGRAPWKLVWMVTVLELWRTEVLEGAGPGPGC